MKDSSYLQKKISLRGVDQLRLLGFNDENLRIIERNFNAKIIVRGNEITVIGNKNEFEKLEKIIKSNPEISIGSYAATEEFKTFIDFLKKRGHKFQVEGIPIKNSLWTTSFFDSKAGFRQAANSLGSKFPEMPQGVICTKRNELIGWMRYFINKKRPIVIKSNRGLPMTSSG